MAIELQYPARCEECNRVIPVGALASFFHDDAGKRRFVHDGDCPKDAPVVERRKRRVEDRYDLRFCARTGCYGAVGIAYPKGSAPPRCHWCQSAWEIGEAEVAEAFAEAAE